MIYHRYTFTCEICGARKAHPRLNVQLRYKTTNGHTINTDAADAVVAAAKRRAAE